MARTVPIYDDPPEGAVLCSCCLKHGGWESEHPNAILDEVVPCVECGEDCSCDGCVADFHGAVTKSVQTEDS